MFRFLLFPVPVFPNGLEADCDGGIHQSLHGNA
jgi:hypothetical protein